MKTTLRIFVPGIPVPKGSKKAFAVGRRAFTVEQNEGKQKPWASLITFMAKQKNPELIAKGLPVCVKLVFYFPRPQSHFRGGKHADKLRADAPMWHTTGGKDLDKLVRCVLDALTSVAYADDTQVCQLVDPMKLYNDKPGVLIEVSTLERWPL
jgi:Holliday junction resolvase RusA-like endonuclease